MRGQVSQAVEMVLMGATDYLARGVGGEAGEPPPQSLLHRRPTISDGTWYESVQRKPCNTCFCEYKIATVCAIRTCTDK